MCIVHMAVAPDDSQHRFTLVIDKDRYEQLKAQARENHRSTGAEIRVAIDLLLQESDGEAERKEAA